VTFEPPKGRDWRVATQLLPGTAPNEFIAPNLQYMMDSPAELGPIAIRDFTVDGRTIRFAAHHTGTAGELEGFVKDVRKIVREQGRIFGEYPDFEPRHFTFLADYLPYAHDDGMEHRNSTVITASSSIRSDRARLLGTVAHEFFHAWNVERIRPRSLEPFDFEGANISSELWLAEGFTQYYGSLTLSRTGLAGLSSTLATFAELAASVMLNEARLIRSAEEMSRMAILTDVDQAIEDTDWSTTVISYYQFGGAIALALDLSLRERSEGRVTLDDYMRALWLTHGRPGGSRPGHVDRPYTVADAEARLAEVSGDPGFARDFFRRFIQGHDVANYERLLRHAGLVLRRARASEAWIGEVQMSTGPHGVRLESDPPRSTPLYAAGAGRGDAIVTLGGRRADSVERLTEALRALKPGDTVPLVVADDAGVTRRTMITVSGNPALELVTLESTGATLRSAERAFRRSWLEAR
jgi:predicted metalloprotease with PDZ domain